MNRRDIEILSAYLDGELKPSELAKVEARLKSDPELESEMKSMRATRTLLRKLPSRKAPRNFTLTRKMVGQNPPLPRSYPIFRFAATVATLLFFFSIGLNSFSSQMAAQPVFFGIGGGGGGGDSESLAEQAPAMEPAMEEPAAPPAPAATEEPAADTEMYSDELEQPDEGAARVDEESSSKTGDEGNVMEAEQVVVRQEPLPLVSSTWQLVFVVIAVGGILFMFVMRFVSARRWR